MDASDRQRRGMPAVRLNSADPFIVNATRAATSSGGLPSVTDEQHQVLRRVSEVGGNVHRNAIPPRMLAVLLSARLLAPYGPSRVELTTLAVRLLAGGNPSQPERSLRPLRS